MGWELPPNYASFQRDIGPRSSLSCLNIQFPTTPTKLLTENSSTKNIIPIKGWAGHRSSRNDLPYFYNLYYIGIFENNLSMGLMTHRPVRAQDGLRSNNQEPLHLCLVSGGRVVHSLEASDGSAQGRSHPPDRASLHQS